MEYIFPNLSHDEVKSRVNDMWDFTHDVPVPTFTLRCPICGCDEVLLKHWTYHFRNKTSPHNPFRCDVHFKCTSCSYVWTHGVVVPENKYKHDQTIYWRDMKDNICGGK